MTSSANFASQNDLGRFVNHRSLKRKTREKRTARFLFAKSFLPFSSNMIFSSRKENYRRLSTIKRWHYSSLSFCRVEKRNSFATILKMNLSSSLTWFRATSRPEAEQMFSTMIPTRSNATSNNSSCSSQSDQICWPETELNQYANVSCAVLSHSGVNPTSQSHREFRFETKIWFIVSQKLSVDCVRRRENGVLTVFSNVSIRMLWPWWINLIIWKRTNRKKYVSFNKTRVFDVIVFRLSIDWRCCRQSFEQYVTLN